MTKMIFIPPFAMLDSTLDSYRHLMLPQLLRNEEYSNHFKRVKRLGQYIILDNGAAEGVYTPPTRLVDTCYDYKVDELVLPDVMGDAEMTKLAVLDFLADYRNRLPISTRLGYVLHGRTVEEVLDTYHSVVANRDLERRISVWYLPRLLVTSHNPATRIQVARYILGTEKMAKPIHFLGAAPGFINEAILIRDELRGRVRSMDTSAPYVYAIAGKDISELGYASRDQERYFISLVSNATRALATRNCEVMNGWVGSQASSSQM